MTLVEFYDDSAMDSVISSLTMLPDKIILLGENYGLRQRGERILSLLRARGREPLLECRSVPRGDVSAIQHALLQIVETEPELTIDLTGGEDLVLFTAGQICERYQGRGIQFHWFNVRTGWVQDCDLDGEKIPPQQPSLTVEELIQLQGGKVVYDSEKPDGSHLWPTDEDFGRDIEAMWAICARDSACWNRQIQTLNMLDAHREPDEDPLLTLADAPEVRRILDNSRDREELTEVLSALRQAELFTEYSIDRDTVRFRYKNISIQQALGKAGTALELMTWHLCRELEYNGEAVYTDAQTGVYIDWDGIVHGGSTPETDNEIDVLLMRGMVPYFISCKNGTIDTEELYKVQTVAERFGGPYARKVLICTTWGSMNEHKQATIRDRAREMGILILEGVHKMSREEFSEALRKLPDWTIHVSEKKS